MLIKVRIIANVEGRITCPGFLSSYLEMEFRLKQETRQEETLVSLTLLSFVECSNSMFLLLPCLNNIYSPERTDIDELEASLLLLRQKCISVIEGLMIIDVSEKTFPSRNAMWVNWQ